MADVRCSSIASSGWEWRSWYTCARVSRFAARRSMGAWVGAPAARGVTRTPLVGFLRASLLGGTPSLTEIKSSPRACAPVTRWVLSPASIGGVHLGTRRRLKCIRLTRHAPALPPREIGRESCRERGEVGGGGGA